MDFVVSSRFIVGLLVGMALYHFLVAKRVAANGAK